MNIRAFEANDIEQVVNILQGLSKFEPDFKNYEAIAKSFIEKSNIHALVALFDGVIVGYGSIIIEEKVRGGKAGHIEDIVSHADYRQKGIGKKIVDSLIQIAKSHGCYKVLLQSQKHNINFYKKSGFEESGISMQIFL